jgi:hypothetical protein
MTSLRYPETFNIEVVKQVTECGRSVGMFPAAYFASESRKGT